jgi:PAS domain S-box-containing protein
VGARDPNRDPGPTSETFDGLDSSGPAASSTKVAHGTTVKSSTTRPIPRPGQRLLGREPLAARLAPRVHGQLRGPEAVLRAVIRRYNLTSRGPVTHVLFMTIDRDAHTVYRVNTEDTTKAQRMQAVGPTTMMAARSFAGVLAEGPGFGRARLRSRCRSDIAFGGNRNAPFRLRRTGSVERHRRRRQTALPPGRRDPDFAVVSSVCGELQGPALPEDLHPLTLVPGIGMIAVDAGMRITALAGDVFTPHGLTKATSVGRALEDVLPAAKWARARPSWSGALEGQSSRVEWVTQNGEGRVDYLLRFAPLTGGGAVMVAQDVTEHAAASRQLARRLRQQEALVQLGALALHRAPLTEMYASAVSLVHEVLGAASAAVLEPDDGAGLSVITSRGERLPPPGPATGLPSVYEDVSETRRPLQITDLVTEHRYSAPALEAAGMLSLIVAPLSCRSSVFGILGACGREAGAYDDEDLVFVEGMANLLSEAVCSERVAADRAEAVQALEQSEERFRRGFDDAPIPMAVIQRGGGGSFRRVNEAFSQLVGRSQDELAALSIAAILPAQDAASAGRTVDGLGDGEKAEFELRYERPDGTTVWGETHVSRLRSDDRDPSLLVQIVDVSDRHAQRDALRRQLTEVSWIGEIRRALLEDRFELHAQPIMSMATQAIVHYELLLRMRGADGELVPPSLFLPTAERYGDILDIDRWVIDQGVQLSARRGFSLSINLSGASVSDPLLADHIELAITSFGADPAKLIFEITETCLVDNGEAATVLGNRLRELGCCFALDDFGTGYGGFRYLKSLALDFLKIDREFVADAVNSEADRHLITAAVDIAEKFGLTTIAEGVEDDETLALLASLGVDEAQGFGIGRPEPLL